MGDMVDNEAVDQLIRLQFAHAQSIPHDALALIRDRMAMGHGAYPLIGTPEQVTEGLIEIHRAGFSGSTFSFFDYNDDFPYFRDTVLPNLVQAGQIGRASCRERVCQYGSRPGVAVALKKKKKR